MTVTANQNVIYLFNIQLCGEGGRNNEILVMLHRNHITSNLQVTCQHVLF